MSPARSTFTRVAVIGALGCGAPPSEPSVLGDWVVSDHLAPSMSSISPEAARQWYGTNVRLDAKQVKFMNTVCTTPDFQRWTLNKRHFETDYGLEPRRLGITADSVRIVYVGCQGERGRGTEFIVLASDQLIMSIDGVFFLLKRGAPGG
jgi:hypothetical protein